MNYSVGCMVLLQNADGLYLTAQIIDINPDNGDVMVLLETGSYKTYTPVEFMIDLEEIW